MQYSNLQKKISTAFGNNNYISLTRHCTTRNKTCRQRLHMIHFKAVCGARTENRRHVHATQFHRFDKH